MLAQFILLPALTFLLTLVARNRGVAAVLLLIALGGLIYTAGVPFYASERLKYATAIWHGFVVTASGCFFAAIAIATAALS